MSTSYLCLIPSLLFSPPHLRDFWSTSHGASTSFKQNFQASTCGWLSCLQCGIYKFPSHWAWDCAGWCAETFGTGIGSLSWSDKEAGMWWHQPTPGSASGTVGCRETLSTCEEEDVPAGARAFESSMGCCRWHPPLTYGGSCDWGQSVDGRS